MYWYDGPNYQVNFRFQIETVKEHILILQHHM